MGDVWVDASSGASGDMLLAALHDLGVPAEVMADAARAVAPVEITFDREVRHGFAVGRAHVRGVEDDVPHRTWADVRELLDGADLDDAVRATAHAAFARLAEAEGRVHGTGADDVHFHEVGAHDAIGDVVGVCAGFGWLGDRVTVGPIALGGGTARSAHGEIPVPVPAVLHLLTGAGAPAHGGPVDVELCTPTGAALLTTLADGYGPMPAMAVTGTGAGAGSRVLPGRHGALRLVRGDSGSVSSVAVVLETNVDDLDPRVWPQVLARLLDAGASDAWLTPILMKKGRPAHTLHVLCPNDSAVQAELERTVFTETSAIGLRVVPVGKTALSRTETTVDVDGHPVRVKLAHLDGRVVNAQPEHDDVLAVAAATGVPLKVVLAHATAAATDLLA
ncbi:nickel pincer cofactor biosynthesis protein LarC [Angustibacter luteus]|uniref:Pyridinium-3,5-bisthiocarboxylic acid mononucleotide nickel insertion protein n=1 Tax=Angustibacter luteus TaxID=658456 RepID=A0ABW1JFA8_9ACTN